MSDDDAASDQRQKESSISLAASSMINASDMISEDAYQANLKRIQEVKEMVQRLEMNNEAAHKNYLVDQLEKRAKDGREAEIMLERLRGQPRFSETVQLTNNVSSPKSEDLLPTTATLVEVPESHPSYSSSSPATTSLPGSAHQIRIAEHPPQVQPYYPNVFRHYVGPSTVRQPPQHVDGRTYTTQSMPSQSRPLNPLAHLSGFQPVQTQQHAPPWSNYPSPVTIAQVANTTSVPGYYTVPSGWIRVEPTYHATSTGSSNTAHREKGSQIQPTFPRLPVTTHNQSQSLPSLTPTPKLPPHGVPGVPHLPTNIPPSHSGPVPVAASKEAAVSQFQRHHRPPPQPQRHRQPLVPQHVSQLPPQPQRHSKPPQPPLQRPSQAGLQPEQNAQQSQELSLQRPLQSSHTHSQALPPSTGRIPSDTSQSYGQPALDRDFTTVNAPPALPGVSQTQSPHPTVVQEQARQRDARLRADQVTFIRLFQTAIQRNSLKAFLIQAKASGISDEWLRAAINSLPRDVLEPFVAQLGQPGATLDTQQSANVSHQQASATLSPSIPMVSVQSSSAATPLARTTPTTHQVASPAHEEATISAAGQTFRSYATQLQYYAEQATKSTHSAQAASILATPPGNVPLGQEALATPTHGVPQAQANARTPKDANKSTLARDILRSLGKVIPKEVEGESTANDHGDNLPEANAQPVSHVTSPRPPVVLPATSFVPTISPSMSSANPNVEDIASPDPSVTKPVLKGHAAVIEGPIVIDLTLEDLDDGKGMEPGATFPIQTSTTATSSQPISLTNTTNHTPLLENLSLEEPPVDASFTGDNADVRMHSPVLSSAEKNMEPEPLNPPLRGTEPVPSSFEPVPHEANEHPLDGRLPLFLPSPPVSPAHTEPPETDLDIISDDGKIRSSLKRRSVDTNETETDTGVPAPRVGKRRKQQVYVLIPPAPPYVKRAIKKMKERAMRMDADSDSQGVGEDEEIQYSHPEQLLIEESKSQLLERRCRWLNCGAILNCAANLLAHLKKHGDEDWQAPFLCRWTGCEREFIVKQDRDVHLERHTIRPLPCPFAGCDEQFNKPVEVMQHEFEHRQVGRKELLIRKPTCQPIVPGIPARLGPPPHGLPSHRVIPRRVVKCRIPADRHAIVGPWILWNIFSPVDLNTRKQNGSMRGRVVRQANNDEMDSVDPRRDDYDFLLALSSYPAKNPQLDDLDSSLITMSAARGLTLWGSGSTANNETGSATPEANQKGAAIISAVEEKLERSTREASRPEERELGQSVAMGEEDDVERMLIL